MTASKQPVLRALTLWRPWLHAILHGGKRIENRPWAPWKSVIGQIIALHAGQRYDEDGARWMHSEGLYDPPEDRWCPRGCIVGLARVTGYIKDSPLAPDPRVEDPWFIGPYGWLLDDVVAFRTPVPCSGAQGLWIVEGDLLVAVRRAYWASRTPTTEADPELVAGYEAFTRKAYGNIVRRMPRDEVLRFEGYVAGELGIHPNDPRFMGALRAEVLRSRCIPSFEEWSRQQPKERRSA